MANDPACRQVARCTIGRDGPPRRLGWWRRARQCILPDGYCQLTGWVAWRIGQRRGIATAPDRMGVAATPDMITTISERPAAMDSMGTAYRAG